MSQGVPRNVQRALRTARRRSGERGARVVVVGRRRCVRCASRDGRVRRTSERSRWRVRRYVDRSLARRLAMRNRRRELRVRSGYGMHPQPGLLRQMRSRRCCRRAVRDGASLRAHGFVRIGNLRRAVASRQGVRRTATVHDGRSLRGGHVRRAGDGWRRGRVRLGSPLRVSVDVRIGQVRTHFAAGRSVYERSRLRIGSLPSFEVRRARRRRTPLHVVESVQLGRMHQGHVLRASERVLHALIMAASGARRGSSFRAR